MGDLLTLGVMGIRGSFSEEAALEYARDNNLGEVEIVELLNTEKVLRSVEAGEVDIGIFALENSNGGVVYESVYAMAAHRFRVVDLFEIDVNHTLLVHPSLPGSREHRADRLPPAGHPPVPHVAAPPLPHHPGHRGARHRRGGPHAGHRRAARRPRP